MKATGLAVKKVSDEVVCSQCPETIKRAAKVCRFCGAENVAPPPPANRPHFRPPDSNVAQEPLRATDNPPYWIFVVLGLAVLVAILNSL